MPEPALDVAALGLLVGRSNSIDLLSLPEEDYLIEQLVIEKANEMHEQRRKDQAERIGFEVARILSKALGG